MKAFNSLFYFCLLLLAYPAAAQQHLSDPVELVNPLMGTASTPELSAGNTYPTISLPFGMNTWVPQTSVNTSAALYTYQSNYIYGFRQTRLASFWIRDYGPFSIMPVNSRNQFTEEKRKSWFSHKAETAKPYYYSTYVADHHARVELAPTERAAIFRVEFHETDSAFIVLDAFNRGSYVKIIANENKIIGYSSFNSTGVADNFKNYFVLEFDRPFLSASVWEGKSRKDQLSEIKADHVGAIIGFKLKKGEKVNVRIASSFISYEQAELNLKEVGKDDFETVKAKAKAAWNKELSKIQVDGGTTDQYKTFYSCFYRMLIYPRKSYEIDKNGKAVHYSPYTGQVLPGYQFADTGFWDTFRAQFPFLNLLYPSYNSELMQGMENIYKESSWLPEWVSPGHRNSMIGSHSASIISDAYLKGVRGFDINLLYEGILKNSKSVGPLSSVGRTGAKEYNDLGYIPFDVDINQSVSRTLEYAYDDFTIYQLAKALKRPQSEIELFKKRSQNYRNLFDPSTGLMRPKGKDGKFMTPFDPFRWGDKFTEANSWHYTWSVFHDIKGLSDLLGGTDKFITKLDSVFSLPPVFDISYYKRGVIHLVREMQGVDMGQYAHANEPMHHVAYLFNHGAPWKAQYWVREIMDKLYTPNPDGYCGEEDNGQLSAWYVFSAMGFYPVCPGSDEYVIGAPLFKKITVKLENGKEIKINAPDNSKDNKYIGSMKVNSKLHTRNALSFSALQNGATVDFQMGNTPNKIRGTRGSDFPFSLSK
ncbi:MAG: glycoside hydrolase family 92 protein [Pedobacter sp.]|nr:MAG: glycoside hydrolase family 92 protein [Pedobacter sp.]